MIYFVFQQFMKVNYYLFIFLIVSQTVFSQSTDRRVYASAGRFTKNVNINSMVQNTITYTLGEPVIYGSTNGNQRITNGFIQADGVVAVSPNVVLLMKPTDTFKLFPNPASTYSTVESSSDSIGTIHIQLIDLNGKLIKEEMMKSQQHIIDLEATFIAPGTYYINFYNEEGAFLQQNKLIKSNTP